MSLIFRAQYAWLLVYPAILEDPHEENGEYERMTLEILDEPRACVSDSLSSPTSLPSLSHCGV